MSPVPFDGKHQDQIEAEHFENYSQKGYWMIQNCDRFWLGMFTDQTIAQYIVAKLLLVLTYAKEITITP